MESRTIAQTKTYTYVICALFAALSAVGAFIKIPMPLVPFTLQFLFTALSGVLLGSKRGMLAQMLYVGIGLAGIPIFTKGGGISYVFQPTFGYLVGFIIGAYIIGKIVEQKGASFKVIFMASFIGVIAIYIFGVIYMYFIVNLYIGSPMPLSKAIYVGAIACLPGDLISCFITSLVGSKLVPILKKQQLI
ncbi:biotin transporter BioY [Cellulosilyticum sp. I15G10I2]|uniref:biotin transporter BioY n=1 Tax=Cellulosilyticum sp. I15G10I2 TaxID=1892843 RepID=UPI00085C3869|nr:biotin transporter BioY [Cellulosilyticum sp. I15G10I2]